MWVSRFRNIVDYLQQYSEGAWNLDAELGGQEQADSVAYAFTFFTLPQITSLTDSCCYY